MSTITKRTNVTLHDNKNEQNGEFFLALIEIAMELPYYSKHLKGKRVYIPNTKKTVELARWDEFAKYFFTSSMMKNYGIKELTYSFYDECNNFVLCTFSEGEISKEVIPTYDNSRLYHVLEQIDKCDVVIGNPEGCKVNEILRHIYDTKKDFILSVNKLVGGFKVTELFMCDKPIHFGHNLPKKYYDVKKEKMESRGDMMWITSFDNGNAPRFINTFYDTNLYDYEKYDNLDAINVDCIKMIPMNYSGVMGVPVTNLPSLNLNQFEIVGFRKGDDGKDLRINGKITHTRVLIKFKNF